MGRRYDEVSEEMKRVPYKVVRGSHDDARVEIFGKAYSPPEISAMILQKLKGAAEDFLGEKVTKAVVTVPAYFNDAQRQDGDHDFEVARIAHLQHRCTGEQHALVLLVHAQHPPALAGDHRNRIAGTTAKPREHRQHARSLELQLAHAFPCRDEVARRRIQRDAGLFEFPVGHAPRIVEALDARRGPRRVVECRLRDRHPRLRPALRGFECRRVLARLLFRAAIERRGVE